MTEGGIAVEATQHAATSEAEMRRRGEEEVQRWLRALASHASTEVPDAEDASAEAERQRACQLIIRFCIFGVCRVGLALRASVGRGFNTTSASLQSELDLRMEKINEGRGLGRGQEES